MSLPVTVVNGSNRNPRLEAADIVGWILWAIGLSIEAVADQQKLNLKKNPASKGRWCNVGVWYWSRHPNYFGEVNITILALVSNDSPALMVLLQVNHTLTFLKFKIREIFFEDVAR